MKTSSRTSDASPREPFWDEPIGPPESPSGLGDIPGLPPYDPESISYDPGGFELIWGFVRGLFRRHPHDRAA
jgi:hypothetical protein